MQPIQRKPNEDIVVTEEFTLDLSHSDPINDHMDNDQTKEFIKDIRKISNSKHTKGIVSDLERDRKKNKFINRIEKTLDNFSKLDMKTDAKQMKMLFKFVLQSCSDAVGNIHDPEIYKLVVSLLKRYAKNDEQLTESIIEMVIDDIKPLTLYRKYKHTAVRSFLFFASWICLKVT